MAYLTDLVAPCAVGGCRSNATKRLMNTFNAPCGDYCTRHARQHLAALQRLEDQWNRRDLDE